MKISEKTLELNIGAELLQRIRALPGFSKAYLRGLTQKEEKQEGVDAFAQMGPATRLIAFQFKAPRGVHEAQPYRFILNREQHDLLFDLAQLGSVPVYYVLPFYLHLPKLHRDVPRLCQDTWVANVSQMPTGALFGSYKSRSVFCQAGKAYVNPEYSLASLASLELPVDAGVAVRFFEPWYRRLRGADESVAKGRRNPWLVRGLRVAIVPAAGV
jgi:hypothetical protein